MSNPFGKSGGSGVPGNLPVPLVGGTGPNVNPATNLPAPAAAPSVIGSLAPPGAINMKTTGASPASLRPRSAQPALPTEEGFPATLHRQIADLENWALANQNDAKRDGIRFWGLKIPAIIGSASAGITAFYGLEVLPLVIGGVASACVLIDGLNPGGALRNAHYKAFYELRDLQSSMVTKWRIEQHKAKTPDAKDELAATIIKESETTKAEISKSLKEAETALAK